MDLRWSKKKLRCLILLLAAFILTLSVSQAQQSRQGVFKPSKEPLNVNVRDSFFVSSVLECAHLCRAEETCEAFKHRHVRDDINCQVTEGEPKYSTHQVDENNEKWTVYTMKKLEVSKCSTDNLCNGVGRCLDDKLETDGFKCECFDDRYGKYCQHEKYYDYDLNFPNATQNNFIDLGTVDTSFNHLTFSAWIKFNPGFKIYPLVSYMEGSNELFTLGFRSDDTSSKTIASFFGNFSGQSVETYTVPINDGYWHHVGFTWSGVTGSDWLLLIDGVLWATKTTSTATTIPSGGVLTVGKTINNGVTYNLVGNISRLNLWRSTKTGEEIEAIAKRPGSRDGDLISWFLLKDHFSDARIMRPSNAAFSGQGVDYSILGPIKYPGPARNMSILSGCLWFKNDRGIGTARFFAYDAYSTFSFGYSDTSLVATVKSSSESRTVTTGRGFRDWHFFCVIWNGLEGEIGLFLDGYVVDAFQHNENLKAQLSPGKLFIVGSLDGGDLEDLGRLSQLNIWDYEISTANVLAMSAGGFNIHGSVLSWGNLATYVLATTMHRNTEIYLPGFTVLAKRSKWCSDKYTSLCPAKPLARLGGDEKREFMEWRCYCPTSLLEGKYTYDFKPKSLNFQNCHKDLIAIN